MRNINKILLFYFYKNSFFFNYYEIKILKYIRSLYNKKKESKQLIVFIVMF